MSVQDQAERLAALNPEKSFIVQAPAGSGKTELLIQRYLGLLSQVTAPEEIIAITFTRKAAAEMQSRILVAIEQARSGVVAESEHKQQTLTLAKAVIERDNKLGWDIHENPSRLRVQTIDSLCASLTRQMPLLARLGSQPETVDDSRPLYEQAAINTLQELESGRNWSDSIARLLVHLDNDLPRIKRLLSDMLAKRDQWLRYVVQSHDRADMETTLQLIIEEHLSYVTGFFPSEFASELCELARYAASKLIEDKPEHIVCSCLELENLPGSKAADLPVWLAVCELLLTKDSSWRKKLNKTNGFPAASENKLEAEERKSMKTRIEGLIQQLQSIPGLGPALSDIRTLPAAQYEDSEWEVIEALSQLLLLSEAQLRLIFSERNQIDFAGLTQSAIQALGDEDAPTDLALHLDYQLSHLLVDEFQDISLNQYQLIERLIAGWVTDEQKSLFLVGDPMQSIYRFREAEVSLFIRTWNEKRLSQLALAPLRLSVNFRSTNAVVDWVNQQFQMMMPELDDTEAGAVSHSPSIAFNETDEPLAVHIHPAFDKNAVDEANEIVSLIQSLSESDADSSIAVLVRSRSHLLEILPALRKAGIHFQAMDIEGLVSQPVIQDLLALSRAYTHLADKVAWLAVLRAPWCALTLESMTTLCSGEKDRTIWQLMNDESKVSVIEKAEQDKLLHVRQIFNNALEQKQRRSLRCSVESLWLNLAGPAALNNKVELDNAQAFFAVLDSIDEGFELKEPDRLLDALESLYAAPESQENIRVQIMSMHKAKGLEFDHVILPGLGKRSRNNDNDLMRWMMKLTLDDSRLLMAPIREAGQLESDIYRYLKVVEKKKQQFEDVRLLYVAATRAKRSLHLFGHANLKYDKNGEPLCQPVGGSLLQRLWPGISNVYESVMHDYEDAASSVEVLIEQSLLQFKSEWQKPEPDHLIESVPPVNEIAADENLIEYEWAGETIKHVGSTVHRYLQMMAEDGINSWNKVRVDDLKSSIQQYLKYLAVDETEITNAVAQVSSALLNIIDDERGRWLLDSGHNDIQNEYALSGVYENKIVNVRIDRTFIDEQGIRWIIDYKTSRHEEPDIEVFLDQQQQRYRQQLEKYASLMQSVEDREIRLGLYFPLLKGWREWSIS